LQVQRHNHKKKKKTFLFEQNGVAWDPCSERERGRKKQGKGVNNQGGSARKGAFLDPRSWNMRLILSDMDCRRRGKEGGGNNADSRMVAAEELRKKEDLASGGRKEGGEQAIDTVRQKKRGGNSSRRREILVINC